MPNASNPKSKTPFFSIIIPTLNEEKYLPLLLEDLASQTNDSFEVIHVDGNSDDKTVQFAKRFSNKLPIKSVVVKKRNVSYQRNKGVERARGQWIVFMDADNRLPRYFLDGIKYQLAKNDDIDVFTTWIDVAEKDKQVNQAIKRITNYSLELFHNVGKPIALGALIGTKREVLGKVRFSESMKVGEDSYFVKYALEAGYSFYILREPQFIFSLRRVKKDGLLKMAVKMSILTTKYVQGGDFTENNYGYEMDGGASYEGESLPFFDKLNLFFKTASKKQLEKARSLFNSLKDFE